MKLELWLAALSVAALAARAQKTQLKVGDMAPDFSLPSTTGKEIKLSDYRGANNVILAFFPAAFTGG